MDCKDNLTDRQTDVLVSVIIPIYNTEKYLAECIESVLSQTHKKLEILLIDDGSTDCSGRIADEYAEKDIRINVRHKENQGVSATRNLGIDMATGEWIAFVDSDDTINNEYIEVLLENAQNFNADVSFGISNIIDEEGKRQECAVVPIVKECFDARTGIIHLLEADLFGCGINKLYRRILWKDYRIKENIRINEDLLHNYNCFSIAHNIIYTNAKMYNYRLRNGSASRSSFDEKQLDVVKVNKMIWEHAKNYWRKTDIPQYAGRRYAGALISVYKGFCTVSAVRMQKQLISMARKDLYNIVKNKKVSLVRKIQCLMLCVCPRILKGIINITQRNS